MLKTKNVYKIVESTSAFLRQRLTDIGAYIDDLFICSSNYEKSERNIECCLELLSAFEFDYTHIKIYSCLRKMYWKSWGFFKLWRYDSFFIWCKERTSLRSWENLLQFSGWEVWQATIIGLWKRIRFKLSRSREGVLIKNESIFCCERRFIEVAGKHR